MRLKGNSLPADWCGSPSFNSRLVRLKGCYQVKVLMHFYRFNSRLVRLKVRTQRWTFKTTLSFNSRLVRLKEEIDIDDLLFPEFQFQIGAIKSVSGIGVNFLHFLFQFQIGAIKSSISLFSSSLNRCFNSRLVRLKEGIASFRCNFSGVSIPDWCD